LGKAEHGFIGQVAIQSRAAARPARRLR
jgi:hypothetical protein